MHPAFFVFLWYCSTRGRQCQYFLRNFCIFYPAHGTLRAYAVRKRRCSAWLRTIRTRIRTRTKIRIRTKIRTRSRTSRPRSATDAPYGQGRRQKPASFFAGRGGFLWGRGLRIAAASGQRSLAAQRQVTENAVQPQRRGEAPRPTDGYSGRTGASAPTHNKEFLQPDRRPRRPGCRNCKSVRRVGKCGGTRKVPPHKGVFSAI